MPQRTPHWLIALALFVASAINGGIAPKFLKNGATWKHATMAFEETLGVREISADLTPIYNCLYEKNGGFHEWRSPKMHDLYRNIQLRWMITRGIPHFWKPRNNGFNPQRKLHFAPLFIGEHLRKRKHHDFGWFRMRMDHNFQAMGSMYVLLCHDHGATFTNKNPKFVSIDVPYIWIIVSNGMIVVGFFPRRGEKPHFQSHQKTTQIVGAWAGCSGSSPWKLTRHRLTSDQSYDIIKWLRSTMTSFSPPSLPAYFIHVPMIHLKAWNTCEKTMLNPWTKIMG